VFQRSGLHRARRRRPCEPSTASTVARDTPASISSAPLTTPESSHRRRVQHRSRGTISCTGWQARLSGEWIRTKQRVWTGRLRTTGALRASTATTRCSQAGLRFNEPLPVNFHNTMSLGYVRNSLSPRFLPSGMPAWKTEHGVEFNALLDVAPMFLLQPTIQYYANVGGGVQRAVVFGFRTKVEF